MKIDARAYNESGKPPVTVEIPITDDTAPVSENDTEESKQTDTAIEQENTLKSKPTPEAPLQNRIAELEKQLAETEQALQEARNDVLRTLAELDTFRRRKNLETIEIRKYGPENLLKALLPALLDLDRLILHSENTNDVGKLFEAVSMLQGKVERALETVGAKKIAPDAGSVFDPNLHEAIGQVPSNKYPPNHIAVIVEPGWQLHEHMLQAAKVLVATPETTPESES